MVEIPYITGDGQQLGLGSRPVPRRPLRVPVGGSQCQRLLPSRLTENDGER